MNNYQIKVTYLVVLPGLMFWLGWPPMKLSFLLFGALVPLFYLEKFLNEKGKEKWFNSFTYLTFLLFNIFTTWWVGYASFGGAIGMLLANSLLMTIPFILYRWTKKQIGEGKALMALVFYWLGFEYLHFNWDIAYPWLTLGNGFAATTGIVQWYEFTGVMGGSLWILLVNIFLYRVIVAPTARKMQMTGITLLFPILLSVLMFEDGYGEQEANVIDLVVVQPNIDPYEKFNEGGEEKQIQKSLDLATAKMDERVDLVVMPETAIVGMVDEDYASSNKKIRMIRDFCRTHDVQVLTGAETYRFYKDGEERSATARKNSMGQEYEAFNTAFLIDESGVIQTYHKSRLVPGAEKMPYPRILRFLEKYALDLGGTTGSLASNPSAENFTVRYDVFDSINTTEVAPLICYESVFGEYVGEFNTPELGLQFVITNDGWWENTAGYLQHMHYARLRAIESGKYVVRCANTGISCVINNDGEIFGKTEWWTPDAQRYTVPVREGNPTFYSRTGDAIGKIASFLAIMFILSLIVQKVTNRINS